MNKLITLILASLLIACSSQKTVSERSLPSDTHKISYGSGGKIVRGNPEKKKTELKIVDGVTVADSDSETSKTLPEKRFSIKYQSKKEKKQSFEVQLKNIQSRSSSHISKASINKASASSGANPNAGGSLALGIISIPLALIVIGIIAAIFGIILSAKALKKGENSTLATVGLVLSIIGLALGILMLLFILGGGFSV
jgi:hypothetical protein